VAGIGPLGFVSPYRKILEDVSTVYGVPLVDSSALVAKARAMIENELERELKLRPLRARENQNRQKLEVVFRVYLGIHPVSKAIYIVGNHPELGDLVPNKITMYDDGTHGDQRAGDTVWSYSAMFSPETQLFYVYTNSGNEGEWEGLDVPQIRSFQVIADNKQRAIYKPIESYGKIYMQADGWHTNAAGYELIAKAILEKLKEDEKVKRYLAEIAANSYSSNVQGSGQHTTCGESVQGGESADAFATICVFKKVEISKPHLNETRRYSLRSPKPVTFHNIRDKKGLFQRADRKQVRIFVLVENDLPALNPQASEDRLS
jgi:hypothetical protein